jgi:hypothetical protein
LKYPSDPLTNFLRLKYRSFPLMEFLRLKYPSAPLTEFLRLKYPPIQSYLSEDRKLSRMYSNMSTYQSKNSISVKTDNAM